MTSLAIRSPHSTSILAALRYQGQSNDCGPFTTATVLNARLGLNLDPADLAQKMNRPVWRGPIFLVRRVPNWATFPWGIADVLREYGMKSTWRPLTKTEFLLAGLERGDVLLPVIGEWKPLWAHVMTLVAWDPQKGWGFANTQYDTHDPYWVEDEKFHKLWRGMFRLVVIAK